jgi:DNA invertase Pin-like site-specific DNA recombinase
MRFTNCGCPEPPRGIGSFRLSSLMAKLIVAKLDRLSRNTRLSLTLIDPARWAILTQMAAVAEPEAALIGERTKAALAKQRGVWLGLHGAETLAPKYRDEATAEPRSSHLSSAKLRGAGQARVPNPIKVLFMVGPP